MASAKAAATETQSPPSRGLSLNMGWHPKQISKSLLLNQKKKDFKELLWQKTSCKFMSLSHTDRHDNCKKDWFLTDLLHKTPISVWWLADLDAFSSREMSDTTPESESAAVYNNTNSHTGSVFFQMSIITSSTLLPPWGQHESCFFNHCHYSHNPHSQYNGELQCTFKLLLQKIPS